MKLQLKRSNVLEGGKAKQPSASQLEYGELAINYNANDPTLFIKDSNNVVIPVSGAGMPDLENPAEQPGTLDDRYVNISGDTMSGELILSGDPTDNLGAASKQYVDAKVAGSEVGVRPGYGISTSALGLQIGDDWSAIPALQ